MFVWCQHEKLDEEAVPIETTSTLIMLYRLYKWG